MLSLPVPADFLMNLFRFHVPSASLLLVVALSSFSRTECFLPMIQDAKGRRRKIKVSPLEANPQGDSFDKKSQRELAERLQLVRQEILEEEWRRPPNAKCNPKELVSEILWALWEPDDPLPESGFLLLLNTATKEWRRRILQSIGAPANGKVDWQIASSALGAAIARPKNQFSLLVDVDEDKEQKGLPYSLEFPFEPLDSDAYVRKQQETFLYLLQVTVTTPPRITPSKLIVTRRTNNRIIRL